MERLKGQICMITGGGGAIGVGIAEKFLKEGALIALCDLNKKSLDDVAHALNCPERIFLTVADVSKEESVKEWVNQYHISSRIF
jgi:NAD(P)-dependent dehydrogenase (short-subunit alcohol dehydrogenase family)